MDEEQNQIGDFRILWVFRPLAFEKYMLLYAAVAYLNILIPALPQIYWLTLVYYWMFPVCAVINLIVTLRVLRSDKWEPYRVRLGKLISTLKAVYIITNLLFWFYLCCPGPGFGIIKHEDTVRIDNHVYHLRGGQSLTYQYDLYKCGRLGVVCHRVHYN